MNKASLLVGCVFILTIPSGCANKLVFATHSSLGLDVSGTAEVPDKVSLAFQRQELAIVPPKSDGTAHSIFGGADSDIGFWSGSTIQQTFATGKAAEMAASGHITTTTNAHTTVTNSSSLVFSTGTSLGIKMSFGDGQIQPNLLLGYRRAEGAYIPVPDSNQEVRSVYADILINTKSVPDGTNAALSSAITTNYPSSKGIFFNGVRIKQSFATGRAAEYAVQNKDINAKLHKAAGSAEGALGALERQGKALSQEVNTEVDKLKENQLDAAGNVMKNTGLVTDLSQFTPLSSFDKQHVLKNVAVGLKSEEDVHKLETYVVELRKLTSAH